MAIRLDKTAPLGYSRKQSLEAKRKTELIQSVLSDQPMTAMEIAEVTKLAEPTVRHHLHSMEKRKQVLGKTMYKIFGDQAKRYFAPDTDMSKILIERQHRSKFLERNEKICEFMRGTIRHKMEVATEFGMKRKTTETLLRDMVIEGLIKTVPAKQFPWRAVMNYYVTVDTTAKQIKASKKAVEAKFAGMKKEDIQRKDEVFEKPSLIPDLPSNLLVMMGYTRFEPTQGQRFNVDEYSSRHPNWNKYQSRKGTQYSQYGSSMRYFELEAGV